MQPLSRSSISVFAHRGNLAGPNRELENSPRLIASALAHGFDLETDIRYGAGGGLYISHDPCPDAQLNPATRHAALWRVHPSRIIALNVKELGQEDALLAFLEHERLFAQVFLFDMELLEDRPGETARLLRRRSPEVRLAARVSDRGEPIERALSLEVADIIWLDEFDSSWATSDDLGRLRAGGKVIYAISPELHGASLGVARRRWRELIAGGVHGIITDWPCELARDLALPGEIIDVIEGEQHASA